MEPKEEKFTELDLERIIEIQGKVNSSYWAIQLIIVVISLVGPLIPSRSNGTIPSTLQEYKMEVIIGGLIMSILWNLYFFIRRSRLKSDQENEIKELLIYEVLKKERSYIKKTYYLDLSNDKDREKVDQILYDEIQVGDRVKYYEAKYSRERLSKIQLCD